MRLYLDTSAAAKLLVEEAESEALVRVVDGGDVRLVALHLLSTELMRAAHRLDVEQSAVSDVLDRVWLHDVPASLFREAGLLPGAHLRSLDALHLAGAVRLSAEALLTYDERLAAAARSVGLAVLAPD